VRAAVDVEPGSVAPGNRFALGQDENAAVARRGEEIALSFKILVSRLSFMCRLSHGALSHRLADVL
jgi:hypothetical protein